MTLLESSFGTLQLRRCADRSAGCPYEGRSDGKDQRSWRRCLGVQHASTATELLLKTLSRGDDMVRLRQLVGDGSRPVAWVSRHQILQQVARKIAQRELCVVVEEHLVTGAQMKPGSTFTAVSAGITPSMLRPSDVVAPAPTRAQELEWMDEIDQPVQVRALEAAARDGVPFCEMCAKAAAEARASAASAP